MEAMFGDCLRKSMMPSLVKIACCVEEKSTSHQHLIVFYYSRTIKLRKTYAKYAPSFSSSLAARLSALLLKPHTSAYKVSSMKIGGIRS